MIGKIFKLIILILLIAVVFFFLWVFDLPPFTQQSTTEPQDISFQEKIEQEQANLPEELQEETPAQKVAREKTYQEHIARAAELRQSGFPSLAINEYQNAYQKQPNNNFPLYQIGEIHYQEENLSQAAETFQTILQSEPNSLSAKINLTKTQIALNDIDQAQQTLNSIQGSNQTVKYYQGLISAFQNDFDRARDLFNQAANQSEDPTIQAKARFFQRAFEEYDFNTESPGIHLRVLIARAFIQSQEYDLSIPFLFEITKEKVDYRDAWILLGYAFLQTEQFKDSIEALERAKTLDPYKAETLFFLGLAYYSINNFDLAEENLVAAREYGYEPRIQIDQKLAEIYLQLQNYQQSAANYERVLSLNDQDINYYIRPIWIYLEKLQQPEKALALADQAFKSHPGQAMSHNLMAWTLIYNDNLQQAENHLDNAMALDPDLDAVYLNYGILFERQGDHQKAISFYKKAHRLGQGNGVSDTAASRYNNLLASLTQDQLKASTASP